MNRLAPQVTPAAVDPDHLEHLLEEVICNVLDNRGDVAITNLTHAVRVASEGPVSERVDVLLRRINAVGGGFAS